MAEPEPFDRSRSAEQAISDELASLHAECYGEDVTAIETHVLDDLVVCVLDVALTRHEATLLEHGRGHDSIRRVRDDFQAAIGATFVATVEHMTGRRVIGFLSSTHLEPPFTVELFRLAPRDNLG